MAIRLLLILLLNIGPILGAEWGKPPAIKPPECTLPNGEACLKKWDYTEGTGIRQLFVDFDEELTEPIIIAEIHCTDCSGENDLQIGKFEIGKEIDLGPELRKDKEGVFSLIINNRLDYENKAHQKFRFLLSLKSSSDHIITYITILDIDDNAPTIISDDIPCIIEENWVGETCSLSISDPDEINTVEKITFEYPDDIRKNFTVNLKKIDDKNAKAVLEIEKGKELDFEKMPVYFFELTAKDGGGNRGNTSVMVKVKDVNDMPPRWVEIFAMESFEEHTDQKFSVYAIDGDLELNEKIEYELNCPTEFQDTIQLNPVGEKADIIIKDIDRENPAVENNANTIKCTLIAKDSLFDIEQEINFIIKDINDNKPIITLSNNNKYPIKLKEEQSISLDQLFSVDDKDEGNNAQFTVTLQNSKGKTFEVDYTEPFQVIPNNGYKSWKFSFSVSQPEILDFDKDTTWRKFSIIIHSADKGEDSNGKESILTDDKEIQIELINLNDEIPVFQDQTADYTANILETATLKKIIM